jgi:hypothetical protein
MVMPAGVHTGPMAVSKLFYIFFSSFLTDPLLSAARIFSTPPVQLRMPSPQQLRYVYTSIQKTVKASMSLIDTTLAAVLAHLSISATTHTPSFCLL